MPGDNPTVISARGEGMTVMPQERLTQFLICSHLLRIGHLEAAAPECGPKTNKQKGDFDSPF